jgi:hypothetical protein
MAVILVGEDPGVPMSHNNKLISIKKIVLKTTLIGTCKRHVHFILVPEKERAVVESLLLS